MRRWGLGSTGSGAALWLWILVAWPSAATFGILGKLFLLAPLVVLPAVLILVRTPSRDGTDLLLYRVAVIAQPFGAIAAAASFRLPQGGLAGILASAWLLVTIVASLLGLSRLLIRGCAPIEEVCLDIGLVYFAVGGVWFVLSRLGWQPLGFSDIIVLLTAVHFHFAGGSLQIIAGLAGRALLSASLPPFPRKLCMIALAGILVGPPLLAAGITASPLLEWGAALLLASSVLLMEALILTRLVPRMMSWAARLLLTAAGASSFLSMGFAAIYAFGEWSGRTLISINYMADVHGTANAFGLVFPSLLAFALLKTPSRARRPGLPFSRLSSLGSTGSDYFRRIGALRDMTERSPTGLIDDFQEYARDDFDPRRLDPLLRSFYERTKDFRLTVTPHWWKGFRLTGLLYRKLADRLGQMCLPVSAQGEDQAIDSVILPLRDEIDGRKNVRAWVRTYHATGKPVYVAAYASHREDGCTYMNIAFPIAGGNITSILKLEMTASGKEAQPRLSLTSLISGEAIGDQGVYLVTRLLPVRLPLNETITVWANEAEGRTFLEARHDMWFFGIKFLTLDYRMERNDDLA